MANSGAAATGCYKCGRPGHWSRDCPSSASNPNPDNNSESSFKTTATAAVGGGGAGAFKPIQKSIDKPKKVPRTRPNLTPELLLSDDGLGYVLKHFPRSFKYHGLGHEASDLGNLISLYNQWHSHLLPCYSFNQFVQKVEQVAATKRVKTCIRDLREKVARGGDPTKFHEPLVANDDPDHEREAMNSEGPSHLNEHPPSEKDDEENLPDDLLHEIYKSTTEEPSLGLRNESTSADIANYNTEIQNQGLENVVTKIQITNEQKARIEANRLKAMEKAASRVRSLPPPA